MSAEQLSLCRRMEVWMSLGHGGFGMSLILSGNGGKGQVADISDYLPEGGILAQRIAKYGRAKLRSLRMLTFLEDELRGSAVGDGRRPLLKRQAGLLRACGTWLQFAYYFGWSAEGFEDEYRLVRANFCDQHLICNFCAVRRSIQKLRAYLRRYRYVMQMKSYLMPFLITFTVKNGRDLGERFEHLASSFRTLQDRRRRYLSAPRRFPFTQLAKVKGGVGTFENTYNTYSKEHHPHFHLIALCDDIPAHKPLVDEWQMITGDSFIVDIRPFEDINHPESAFMEVFKYTLKFSTMPLDVNYHASRVLAGRRLLISFGDFWGVKVPELLTDEALDREHVDYYFEWLNAQYQLMEVVAET